MAAGGEINLPLEETVLLIPRLDLERRRRERQEEEEGRKWGVLTLLGGAAG